MRAMLLIEKVTAAWWTLTTVAVLALWSLLADPWGMLANHAIVAVCVGAAWWIGSGRFLCGRELKVGGGLWGVDWKSWGLLLRLAVPLSMLSVWYGETYAFCSLLPYQDHLFASADQWLTGLQPSIAFSEWLTGGVWSELFNLGYWSYFPMQLAVVLYYFFCRRDEAPRVAALILAAFFCFYLIYFMLPVAGPQYYFAAIGLDNARAGVFPEMGRYFATHTDMLPAPGWSGGLFYSLVSMAQDTGEFPTAAFPSSHVGCTVVFLCLALRRSVRLFVALLPFAVLLMCATVYIQAHYLIDSLCGFVAGLAVYALLSCLLKARWTRPCM